MCLAVKEMIDRLIMAFHVCLQFVGVEGFVKGVSDLFASQLHGSYRREAFVAICCLISFLIAISMVMEV